MRLVDWSGPLTLGPPSLMDRFNRILRQVYRPAMEAAIRRAEREWNASQVGRLTWIWTDETEDWTEDFR